MSEFKKYKVNALVNVTVEFVDEGELTLQDYAASAVMCEVGRDIDPEILKLYEPTPSKD